MQSTGFQGDQMQFIAMQQDANCYGQVYPPYQAGFPFYSSSDSSICNPDLNIGNTTGVGPGEALINGGWTADAWFFGPTGVCDYTPEEVVREAICDILSRRVDSVSPDRALIGQPVDVVIKGSGFGTETPMVSAGSGIAVSNIQLINSGEVRARFTIGLGASAGNQAVSVTTSLGLTTTVSGNFYVQIPYAFSAISVTQTDGGCQADFSGYGAQVLYQVVDEQGQPIAQAGMTPEEFVTFPGGGEGSTQYDPFATPPTTDTSGRLLDKPIVTCFRSDLGSNPCRDVRQEFRIRIPTSSGEQLYFLPTVTTRRDCRLGIRVTVTTGISSQISTLGTVN